MRSYVATTGVVFALIIVAHVARLAIEGASVLKNPIFLLSTVAAIVLCVWAVTLLRTRGAAG